jgi:hypothetical protein
MRAALIPVALLLSACMNEATADDPVSAVQMSTIHAELRSEYSRRGLPAEAHRVGCAQTRLGAKRAGSSLAVYLRYACGAWALSCPADPTITTSSPAVVHLRENAVRRWQFPGDGTQYGQDIKAWFPKGLREKALFPGNQTVDRLVREAFADAGCSN